MASHLLKKSDCVEDRDYAMCGRCGHGLKNKIKAWPLKPSDKVLLENRQLACPACGNLKNVSFLTMTPSMLDKQQVMDQVAAQKKRIEELEQQLKEANEGRSRGQHQKA